jgi:hypothetical protein
MSKIKNYITNILSPSLNQELYNIFDCRVGKDVSLYILSFVKKNNNKCDLCNCYIYNSFSNCLKCKSIICYKCYHITSQFNNNRPYCQEHFPQPIKKNKKRNSFLKKRLIEKMRKRMKHKYITLLEFIYRPKPYKCFIHQYFSHERNGNFIKTPNKKCIKSNSTIIVNGSTLTIIMTDNIFDAYDYISYFY